jgi:hypothetical protein
VKDPYEILGVARAASPEQIRNAYRRRAGTNRNATKEARSAAAVCFPCHRSRQRNRQRVTARDHQGNEPPDRPLIVSIGAGEVTSSARRAPRPHNVERYLPRLDFREQVDCTASALFAAAELHHYKGRGLNRGGRSTFDQLDIVEAGFFRFIALATDGYHATIRRDEPPSPSVCMITVNDEVSRMHRPGPLPGRPGTCLSVRHRGEQYNHLPAAPAGAILTRPAGRRPNLFNRQPLGPLSLPF